jgi:hypothetical protein
MDRRRVVHGEMVQADQPDWRPLRRLLPDLLVDTFMWMFQVRLPSEPIHAYKHVVTRRYVHLSASGRAYVYVGDERYTRIAAATALELALAPWWEELGASPEETVAAWAALAAVRGGR